MNPTDPKDVDTWASLLAGPSGGWVATVIVGIIMGIVIVALWKKYENYRESSEKLIQGIIKDQTELMTQNKMQNDQIISLMVKVNDKL